MVCTKCKLLSKIAPLGEKKLGKVITPDVAKKEGFKVAKIVTDSKEETKGEGSSIGGLRKYTESVSQAKEETSIVGSDKRMLSGLNMQLVSKSQSK